MEQSGLDQLGRQQVPAGEQAEWSARHDCGLCQGGPCRVYAAGSQAPVINATVIGDTEYPGSITQIVDNEFSGPISRIAEYPGIVNTGIEYP